MRQLYKYTVPTLGVLLTTLSVYLIQTRTPESNDNTGLTITLICLAAVLIYGVNALLTKALNRHLPWEKYQLKRFAIQVIAGLLLSLTVINVLYTLLKDIYTDTAPDMGQYIVMSIYGAATVVPIIAIYFGIQFLRSWQKSIIKSERLEKENARSQMMSLRNHLDPHFLFNNLNVLSALIDHDVALSKVYLEKFAEVYRTILKSELSDLTLLEDELKLMKAYIYLINIRWQDALSIDIQISEGALQKALPPLSSQMLLENVIKHNTISKSKPVHIGIRSDDNYLIISNNKNAKIYADEKKSGTGLANIQNRYEHFTDKEVIIKDTSDTFSVQLPLLDIE